MKTTLVTLQIVSRLTEFTKEFVYLFVYIWKLLEPFGTFWNLLKKVGEFEFGIEVEFELNLNKIVGFLKLN